MRKREKFNYQSKNYIHIDGKRVFNNKTENYVKNKKKIESHSFYPFIRYVNKSEKYYKDPDIPDSRPIKTKRRKIMYASHIDNFIYKYYGELLNEKYNEYAESQEIDSSVIGYRSKPGVRGKSNINYAAEVINHITKLSSCYIMIGDFKGYFDTLDHQMLKEKLCKVLGYNKNKLPTHWYKVLKSVTTYSYYNQKRIHKYCGTDKELKQKKQYKYFRTPKEFRKFRALYSPTKNVNDFGIPQGTAISAVLSNVYAIDLDQQINQLISEYNGIYKRYSDDFIVIIPKYKTQNEDKFNEIINSIYLYIEKNKMLIEKDKTKCYQYQDKKITKHESIKLTRMDYLGFMFDGRTVEMRGKSPYKFYRKAERLIKKAKKVQKEKKLKKLPYRKRIYALYTDLGIERRPYGNFLTYARRSQIIFDEYSPNTNNQMMRQVNNRRNKINKMLGYSVTHVSEENGNR